MTKHSIVSAVLVDEILELSFLDVCKQNDISEEMLLEMLEHGLLDTIMVPSKHLVFSGIHIKRIVSACRLHRDLGINPAGVILALELMDERDDLQQQLQILRRHIQGD